MPIASLDEFLRGSPADFRAAFDQSAIIGITDLEGVITFANDRLCEVSGYAREELIGQTFRLVNSGHHPPEYFAAMWRDISAGRLWRGEFRNRAKDGAIYWVDCTIYPILGDDGRPAAYLSVRFDITARKVAEEETRRGNALLSAISLAQSQFITAVNRLEIFEGLLVALLELTDSEYGFIGEVLYRPDGSRGMDEALVKVRDVPYLKSHSITNIAWDETTQRYYEENYRQGMEFTNLNSLFGAVMVTGEPVIANSPATDPRRGGTPHGHPPLNAFLGIPFYRGRELMGMVGIANRAGGYDESVIRYLEPFLMTCANLIEGYRIDRQRRDALSQLAERNAELQRATRLKDQFLANMSHELRTPLNAILGLTESLIEGIYGPVEPTQQEALATVERSGVHLLELINDILNLAKIEAGELELEPGAVQLADVCHGVLDVVRPLAQRKGLSLQCHAPAALPVFTGDARRLRQVFLNLLNNAVKFTDHGGAVTIGAEHLPGATGDEDRVRVTVSDTGIGIAPEHLPLLFQPFRQIDSALNRRYEGTGLGLALVQRLVALHGGDVRVESTVGVGSRFIVELPARPWSEPATDAHVGA
jgi:PAS domain S-box-containing protein